MQTDVAAPAPPSSPRPTSLLSLFSMAKPDPMATAKLVGDAFLRQSAPPVPTAQGGYRCPLVNGRRCGMMGWGYGAALIFDSMCMCVAEFGFVDWPAQHDTYLDAYLQMKDVCLGTTTLTTSRAPLTERWATTWACFPSPARCARYHTTVQATGLTSTWPRSRHATTFSAGRTAQQLKAAPRNSRFGTVRLCFVSRPRAHVSAQWHDKSVNCTNTLLFALLDAHTHAGD